MARQLQMGDKWFLVSSDWWQRAVVRGEVTAPPEYVGAAGGPGDTRIQNDDIVDATRSCRCCDRSVLHPGLVEGEDYRVVSERVWRALALEFGFDWEVCREVTTASAAGIPRAAPDDLAIDVYPTALEQGGHRSGNGSMHDLTQLSSMSREWREDLKLGQLVDALDTDSKWYEARVVELAASRVKIHYRGWSVKWDEWLPRSSPRLMPLHSKVRDWRRFRVNDAVQVGTSRPGKRRLEWRDATVLATTNSLLVQIRIDDEVLWMDAQDERLCPPGTHRATNSARAAALASPSGTSTTNGSSSNSSTPTRTTASGRKRRKTSGYNLLDD